MIGPTSAQLRRATAREKPFWFPLREVRGLLNEHPLYPAETAPELVSAASLGNVFGVSGPAIAQIETGTLQPPQARRHAWLKILVRWLLDKPMRAAARGRTLARRDESVWHGVVAQSYRKLTTAKARSLTRAAHDEFAACIRPTCVALAALGLWGADLTLPRNLLKRALDVDPRLFDHIAVVDDDRSSIRELGEFTGEHIAAIDAGLAIELLLTGALQERRQFRFFDERAEARIALQSLLDQLIRSYRTVTFATVMVPLTRAEKQLLLARGGLVHLQTAIARERENTFSTARSVT